MSWESDQVLGYVGPEYAPLTCLVLIVALLGIPFLFVSYILLNKLIRVFTLDRMLAFANAYGFVFFFILTVRISRYMDVKWNSIQLTRAECAFSHNS